MRYTIANQHINYYLEHGFIEFEEVIDQNLLEEAKNKLPKIIDTTSSNSIYKTGRDLFRNDFLFQKISKNSNLAHIAKDLTGAKYLQLAFDQVYSSNNFFKESDSLEEYFSFQNLKCIAIIRLDHSTTLDYSENFQAPMQFANVVFVNPHRTFDLSSLQKENQCLFFIGYASDRTVYKCNPSDLNNSNLKRFGYCFGDRLQEEHHPIVS